MPATTSAGAFAPNRDILLDSMRGLMVVCMAINHLPCEARYLTDKSVGLFSAAEGFVFLSGLLAGYVYTRRRRRAGPDGLKTAVLQRAGVIYRWHLAAYTIAFAVLGFDALISGRVSLTSPELFWHHPARSMLLGPLLLYQPGLLDILPIYCLFVLLLPTVLAALEQGQRWKVLAVSCGVWSCAQFAPTFDGAHLLAPFNFGALNPLAWQFLFVGGVVIGHARVDAPATMVPGRTGLLAAALVGAVFFFALQHGFISPPWPNPEFGVMLNKPSLGFLRLASFALVAYLVAVVAARFPRLLTSRLLALIGRHSLPLVAVHCVLVLLLLAHSELFATATGRWGVMIFVLCVLVAIAGVCEHVKIPIAPRAPVGSFPFPLRGGLGERSAAVQR